MKKLFTLLLAFSLFACGNKREEELQRREQSLAEKEAAFMAEQADCESLKKMRDSLMAVSAKPEDSAALIRTWPDSLRLQWNSKMICRESNCSNYVIGDQRNETWQFMTDSMGIYTNVLNNKKLLRRFRASYQPGKIMLDFDGDSTSNSRSRIKVVLDDIKPNVIKGTQIITGQDNCSATFSVELTPSQKP